MHNLTTSHITLDPIPSEIHSSISDITEAIFYVYQWVREDGSPYYIGKGKGKRAWVSAKGHRPPKDLNRIQMIVENVYEHESFILEKFLIAAHGRKDLGTGILRNLTDGGEGLSGYVCSDETRKKLSVSHTGKPVSQETRLKLQVANTGKSHGEETRIKIGDASRGRVQSLETRAKISKANKGRRLGPEYAKTISDRHLDPIYTEKWRQAHMGRVCSEETRLKLSVSNTGKKASDSAKEKMSLAKIGKVLSPEHRVNIGLSQVGRKHSEESILKMSLAKIGRTMSVEATEKSKATKRANRLAKLALLENTKNE